MILMTLGDDLLMTLMTIVKPVDDYDNNWWLLVDNLWWQQWQVTPLVMTLATYDDA
jgi:hypothetical protein